ncbi:MAG: thymidine phosphorylase [Fimbriimonas sp.]
MDFGAIIATRRDGKKHRREDIQALARGAADGSTPDYQLAAWLMAAYLNPLDDDETAWLTQALADSGDHMDLSGLPKPWVDKHSTGGVGDKTTIVLLPLLAACGLTLVKMSGRGLGITGGTIDKLESVPGFDASRSPEEMKAQAREIGLAITGQSPDLAPADKVLYALRDVTGTTSSIPLLVSSILSKKIAGGAETIVLDVKSGSGAFMRTAQGARDLAGALARTAKLLGLNCRLAITDMNQPLGAMIGNALEVQESRDVLTHPGDLPETSARVRDLCLDLAAITLEACGKAPSREAGHLMAEVALTSGRAREKARQWFAAQGGDFDAELPKAPVVKVASANSAGWVSRLDAETLGRAVIALGGGRRKKDDVIDPAVGIELHHFVGSRVEKGAPLFTVHAATEDAAREAAGRVTNAFNVAPFEVKPDKLVQTTL